MIVTEHWTLPTSFPGALLPLLPRGRWLGVVHCSDSLCAHVPSATAEAFVTGHPPLPLHPWECVCDLSLLQLPMSVLQLGATLWPCFLRSAHGPQALPKGLWPGANCWPSLGPRRGHVSHCHLTSHSPAWGGCGSYYHYWELEDLSAFGFLL